MLAVDDPSSAKPNPRGSQRPPTSPDYKSTTHSPPLKAQPLGSRGSLSLRGPGSSRQTLVAGGVPGGGAGGWGEPVRQHTLPGARAATLPMNSSPPMVVVSAKRTVPLFLPSLTSEYPSVGRRMPRGCCARSVSRRFGQSPLSTLTQPACAGYTLLPSRWGARISFPLSVGEGQGGDSWAYDSRHHWPGMRWIAGGSQGVRNPVSSAVIRLSPLVVGSVWLRRGIPQRQWRLASRVLKHPSSSADQDLCPWLCVGD